MARTGTQKVRGVSTPVRVKGAPSQGVVGRTRPGGRSARVLRDVLSAALEIFAEHGYAALSIESVALRAGVNKTTVYRRWPSKPELLGAALLSLRESEEAVPDTGSLREDLFQIVSRHAAKLVTKERRAITRALLMTDADVELGQVLQRLRHERPTIPRLVFERAIARGQLPLGTDTLLLIETILSTVHARAYWKREELSDNAVRALLELIVRGAESGGACPLEHRSA